VSVLDPAGLKQLVESVQPAIEAHRSRALNPNHPHQRGTSQGPDIYFQMLESSNKFYQAVPDLVQETMDEVSKLTGRPMHLFDYYGHPEAEHVVVAMGSGCQVGRKGEVPGRPCAALCSCSAITRGSCMAHSSAA
jgi:pyruvate-ferredoxin/flavodoxin oxidoreductase